MDELVADGVVSSVTLPLWEPVTDEVIRSDLEVLGGQRIRFFWSRRARYVARQAEAVRKLVTQFSTTGFGRALGHQGESMFDAALPTKGFMPRARGVRAWGDRQWTETEHDLDRVFERDGIAYGTEIKNKLGYIEREELRMKLQICAHLKLKPLFIVRMAPKNYIEEVRQAGGYTLVVEWQLYPYGADELAKRVRDELSLPVDCPARIADGTVQRFLRWHIQANGAEA